MSECTCGMIGEGQCSVHRAKRQDTEIDRLTAELAICRDAVKKHQQDLFDENEKVVKLRAELEANAKMLEKVRDWHDLYRPRLHHVANRQLDAILTDESEAKDDT